MKIDLIPAVAYIRMSSDKQEASPDRQRAEIVRLAAKHGYRIIREYFDGGITGVNSQRKQFQAMVATAAKGEFKAILCWDQDRFSRLDSIDSGEWIAPLRRAGVKLVTVAQGITDWNSFAGRVVFNIQQEGKNAYLVDLSRNVTSGILRRAKANKISVSLIPFGFEKHVFDERGQLQRRVKFGERFSRPKSWTAQLAIADDSSPDIIREIFKAYVLGKSPVAIATDLNARGIKSPRGGTWARKVLMQILKNPAYVGHTAINRTSSGKFFGIQDGEVTPISEFKRPARRLPTARDQWVVCKGTHAAIVSAAIWRKAQERIERTSSERQLGHRPRRSQFVLSGILYCGHCGARMRGRESKVKRRDHVDHLRRYYCPTHNIRGLSVCRCRSLKEEGLTEFVVAMAAKIVGSEPLVSLIQEEIELLVSATESPGAAEAKLKKQLRELEAKLDRATENILLADVDHLPAARKKMTEWQEQKGAILEQLNSLPTPRRRQTQSAALSRQAIREIYRLRENIKSADSDLVREALATIFERVDLWFEGRQCETKHFSRFSRGLLTLRPGFIGVLSGTDCVQAVTQSDNGGAVVFGPANIKADFVAQRAAEWIKANLDGVPRKEWRSRARAAGFSDGQFDRGTKIVGESGVWPFPHRERRKNGG